MVVDFFFLKWITTPVRAVTASTRATPIGMNILRNIAVSIVLLASGWLTDCVSFVVVLAVVEADSACTLCSWSGSTASVVVVLVVLDLVIETICVVVVELKKYAGRLTISGAIIASSLNKWTIYKTSWADHLNYYTTFISNVNRIDGHGGKSLQNPSHRLEVDLDFK